MDLTRTNPSRRAIAFVAISAALWITVPAWAQAPGPDGLIRDLSSEVLSRIKADASIRAGDIGKLLALVESTVMPHVDGRRMTASAVGRFWRTATPQQRMRLEEEFMQLVVRTYAGALTRAADHTVQVMPIRAAADDLQAVVKTVVRGSDNPVHVDYRLVNTPEGWKIFDVNLLGVWLTQIYQSSFAHEIDAGGIEGLISALAEKNRSNGGK